MVDRKARAYLYFQVIVAVAGTFNWSYGIILMSGAILYVRPFFNITGSSLVIFAHRISPSWIEGLTMSTGLFGTVAGMMLGSRFTDKIGRKNSLILGAILLGVGAVGSSASNTLAIWNCFRFVGGVGGGLALLVAPIYASEIAPAEKRGSLVTFTQMGIILGAFAANLSTYGIARLVGSKPDCWRLMCALGCLPIGIFLIGLYFVGETPRWLVMKGREEEARAALVRTGAGNLTERTMQAIGESLIRKTGSLRELIRPGVRIATLIAFGLAIFDQWVGVPTLVYYAPTLFVKVGVSTNASAIGNTVLIRVGDIFWTLFAIYWVDRFGRRPLLLLGTLGIAAGQLLMGWCFSHQASPTLVLIAFFVCEATFNASLPSVAWLVVTEIFPTRLRARGMAIHGSMRFGSSLVLAQVFPPMVDFFRTHFGSEASVFRFFALVALATFVFSFLLVPETRGKTLEEASSTYFPGNVD